MVGIAENLFVGSSPRRVVGSARRRRRGAAVSACAACTLGAIGLLLAGCYGDVFVPDQSVFVPLESLRASGQAVVRVYGRPIAGLEAIAVHPYFVIKTAEATEFDRWEVQAWLGGPYGHVKHNLRDADEEGKPGVHVIAELIGPEAEAVSAFIETQSPVYPCRDVYVLWPGPNSSSYAQWVLDNTGWDVVLPPTTIGKDVPAVCPSEASRRITHAPNAATVR